MQSQENLPTRRAALILLPFLILAGLLVAPPTRALLQAQLSLLFDATPFEAAPFVNPLKEMGSKAELPAAKLAGTQSRINATVARFPSDYAIQLAAALHAASEAKTRMNHTAQENYAAFRLGAEGLARIQARFPERPAPYAHILREMTQATVCVSREGEVEKFQQGKPLRRQPDRQVGYAESWAAFDQAAAQGEKLDPDNAYFPMMRAVWLFDAKRDAEGTAAILRAGQKSRFEDYGLEEQESAWMLSRRAYGPGSALLRRSLYGTVMFPHLLALRSVARLTAYKAEQAEQQGRIQEGLALRHAMMQCGLRMREQGHLVGALVGTSIVLIQTNLPGGTRAPTAPVTLTTDQKADRQRDLYIAYLRRIGAEREAAWFAPLHAEDSRIQALIYQEFDDHLEDAVVRSLPNAWMFDLLLLTNLLGMLLLCIAASVCMRLPGGEKKLPLVVLGLAALCLFTVLPMQWAEALTQMHVVLNALAHHHSDSGLKSDPYMLSDLPVRVPWVIHLAEVFFALSAPMLVLIGIKAVSLMRRETFSAALARGMRRGALVFTILLTVAYACALVATARMEARADFVLDNLTHNGVAYLQRQAQNNRKP